MALEARSSRKDSTLLAFRTPEERALPHLSFNPSRRSSLYPLSITQLNHVASAPRRVRGLVGGRIAFDTTSALYVWEWPHYPQYYIPGNDVEMSLLVDRGDRHATPQGTAQPCDIDVNGIVRKHAAWRIRTSPIAGLEGSLRFSWDALDQWFEEEEEVFVHPRDPYHRVDAVRSRRSVRIEFDGVMLAESSAPIMVFETGLPTRYYVDQCDIRFERLVSSETRTACPYKGRTTRYWSIATQERNIVDAAWAYDFPMREVLPIAGLVAFLNEKVDIFIDGLAQPRPVTHIS